MYQAPILAVATKRDGSGVALMNELPRTSKAQRQLPDALGGDGVRYLRSNHNRWSTKKIITKGILRRTLNGLPFDHI